jgi:hypothetical protein
MKDHKRDILKQLITGSISPQDAAKRLKADAGTTEIALAILTADGLYAVGSETGLTRDEMKALLAGRIYVEIDEESSLLGSGPPDLVTGKDGTVFILPCNNR